MTEYLQNPLWLIEILAMVSMWSFQFCLAQKKRWGWLLYLVFCAGMMFIFFNKESWITVFSQTGLILMAIRNLFLWNSSHEVRQKWLWLDWLAVGIFVTSVWRFWPQSGVAWFEVLMWCFILTKQILWGRKILNAWWVSIMQHVFGGVFFFVSGTYMLLLRVVVEISLGAYGLVKWKK